MLICNIKGGAEPQITSITLMDMPSLTKYKDIKAKNLSGGNQRKLTFALAIVTEPRYLLLDEPTRGLDPVSRRELYSYLRVHSLHTSVVLIT